MGKNIHFTIEPPKDFKQLQELYESLGWNSLNLTVKEIEKMCLQSWYAIYAFDQEKLVGMGRVISDGVITGLVCGICVLPSYQANGLGKEIINNIVQHCEHHRVIPQLMCVESLESYYEELGFKKFTIGMSKNIIR